MHAGLAFLMPDLQKTLRLGAEAEANIGELPLGTERLEGHFLANAMAVAFNLGFGFWVHNSLLDEVQARKAKAFFEDNFVLLDPYAEAGQRYYQGKFLIRTSRPGDDMSVLLRFCPYPERLYLDTPFGKALDPLAVAETRVLSEADADALEQEPERVDLVIRFKDSQAIIALMARPNVDIAGLLLENLVQLRGHVGHLFKLGAIASDIQLRLSSPQDD